MFMSGRARVRGRETNQLQELIYFHLAYGWLSLPVRFQVIQWIASIAVYVSYQHNPISVSVKAHGETGILISSGGVQSLGLYLK